MGVRRFRIAGWLLSAALVLPSAAWAQLDLVGNWARRGGEDTRPLGGEGAHIGDYTGIPFSEAGRVRAETWDATVLSQRERQAQQHPAQYHPQVGRTERVLDPVTGNLVAYTMCCHFAGARTTIWLDGRPHPPLWGERDWSGFSTGVWNGNILTATTTHLRTGMLNRNGTPASLHSKVTRHFIRHGDNLTVVQFVEDPAYLDMPLIRTTEFVLNPVVQDGGGPPNRMEIIDEVPDWELGYVPSYALGARHTDWAEYVGLPYEATRGGLEKLLPEYVPVLEEMLRAYQAERLAARGAN
jgi:hypothetical protein